MGKPLVNEGSGRVSAPLEPDWPILLLPSDSASGHSGSPFVAVVRSRAELSRWLINPPADRKSTRLNSSHTVISYAVFCLKKKKSNLPYVLLAARMSQPA